ncbi:MAG: prolyl aminopeptidase [Synechococcaceae cyanobacterium RM1_1_27]|nr:prolyl aminopeptidase [Synechococcaceae cyanobacterium RM1_1_27]
MPNLHPPIEPFQSGELAVSELHTLYYEQVGNPEGKPVVFLHGGPGGGCNATYRRYFDPQKWRVILFDQRGCGRSRPHAELTENTTWDLVADIERLRQHLGIDRWCVFGGSWGSTLALAYSQTHPEACVGLILRGIFMLRQRELHWFYQEGASNLFPDAWEHYLEPIPESERENLIEAYYRQLTSPDPVVRQKAAQAWSVWEASTSHLWQKPELMERFAQSEFSLAFARIECHYFVNKGFLTHENQLLEGVKRIRHLPGMIVQGRYDVVCPPVTAWDLHRAWPEADFQLIPDAGHSMSEPGIQAALLDATDRFAAL